MQLVIWWTMMSLAAVAVCYVLFQFTDGDDDN